MGRPLQIPPRERTCTKCGETKSADRFVSYINPRRENRRCWFNLCKQCHAANCLARYIRKRLEQGKSYAPKPVETAPEGFRTCRKCGTVYPDLPEYLTHTKGSTHVTCKKCLAEKARRQRAEIRLEVLAYYSNGEMKCQCPGCNESHVEFLSLDHIRNDGRHQRKTLAGDMYTFLKRKGFPDNLGLRVLCFNCNSARQYFGGPEYRCPVHEAAKADVIRLAPREEGGSR